MFGVDDAIIIASMAAGALGGSIAQGKRTRANYQNLVRAQWEAEQIKKNKDRTKRILTGDMSIAALQTTAQSREAAMEAFQGESKGEAGLGVSGMSSGTPFYKLQQDIRDNATRIAEMDEMARLSMENRNAQAGAAMEGNIVQEARADWAVADLQAQQNYLDDPLSAMMALGTGALQGAATGMQITAGLTKLGIFDKPLTPGGMTSREIRQDLKTKDWLYSGDEGRFGFDYPKTYLGQTLSAPSDLGSYVNPRILNPVQAFDIDNVVNPNPTMIADAFSPNNDLASNWGFGFDGDLTSLRPLRGKGRGAYSMFSLGGTY